MATSEVMDIDAENRHHRERPQKRSATSTIAGRRKRRVRIARSAGLLPPSPAGEQATTSKDKTWKSSTGDGGGHTTGDRRIVVSLKATIAAQDKLSDGLSRTGMDVEIVCGLIGLTDIHVANE